MAERKHEYRVDVRWVGNTGVRAYGRNCEVTSSLPGKPVIPGSADSAFRGEPNRWNPEELYVASISACHKLSYLYLCAAAGIVVTEYLDHAEGILVVSGGTGRFASVTLRPSITLARRADIARAASLHAEAHAKCFIANSIATPVRIEPTFTTTEPTDQGSA